MTGTESVYTPLYRLLEQLGAGRKSTSALSRCSRHSGKRGRPCIVMEDNANEDYLFPDICIMATFEGAHPSELTSLHRDFIVPVSSSSSPSSSSSSSSVNSDTTEEDEIFISPPVEGGDGHRSWIVAFPYTASNPVKPRPRVASADGRTSLVSPESLDFLSEISETRLNIWQKKARRDPQLIRQVFGEVQVYRIIFSETQYLTFSLGSPEKRAGQVCRQVWNESVEGMAFLLLWSSLAHACGNVYSMPDSRTQHLPTLQAI